MFAYAVERLIEGEHAAIHRACANARYASESYSSLARRMPEIKELVRTPGGLLKLCKHIDIGRSPGKVTSALGMSLHPAIREVNYWSRVHRMIVYRADLFSLYQHQLPTPDVGTDGPDLPDALAAIEPVDADGDDMLG